KAETRAHEIEGKISGYADKVEGMRKEALLELGPWLVPAPAAARPDPSIKNDTEFDPAQLFAKSFDAAEGQLAGAKKLILIQLLKEKRFFYLIGGAAILAGGMGLWLGGLGLMAVFT